MLTRSEFVPGGPPLLARRSRRVPADELTGLLVRIAVVQGVFWTIQNPKLLNLGTDKTCSAQVPHPRYVHGPHGALHYDRLT